MSKPDNKKMALGRGLGALIQDANNPVQNQREARTESRIFEIEISKIEANPFQPRQDFDEEKLSELAASIQQYGLIQPVTVRKINDGRYQLISGERRYRASLKVGLKQIPAYVRETDDQGALEMALVENIQRDDLNAIEVAISYKRLMEECSFTQEVVSDRVGKKRATVSNYLRLLRLPEEIQVGIREEKLSMGHARTLITIEDIQKQLNVYHQIVENDLSVRACEDLVRKISHNGTDIAPNKQPEVEQPEIVEKTELLKKYLNSHVEVKATSKGAGKIIIPFKSRLELERLVAIFELLEHK